MHIALIKKINNTFIKDLPKKFCDFLTKFYDNYKFYQNINFDPTNSEQKRILISYITYTFENDISKFTRHTNLYESLIIIKKFIDYGFSIDLVNCLDKTHNSIINKKKYDIIFGFGEPFYSAAINNKDNAIKIVYLTESDPDFSLKQETERLVYFYQRHKKKALIKRSGRFLKTRDINVADYAILFGNEHTARTFSIPKNKLYLLKPTGFINSKYIFKTRNIETSRKNFIWFGSEGAIHKGLDLLVDVFNDLPEYNLYICGLDKREKALFKINNRNIFDLGFINIESNTFLALMDSCSYVVLPSCSEGMATSVLTCMNHGLIPIITPECGIDLQDWGIYLNDYSIEYIKEIIIKCATCESKAIEEQHKKIFSYSRKTYNLQRFSQDFQQIIFDIIYKEALKA